MWFGKEQTKEELLFIDVERILDDTIQIYENPADYGTGTPELRCTDEAAKKVIKRITPRARPYTEEEMDQVHEDILLLDKDMKPTGVLIKHRKEWNTWEDASTNHGCSGEIIDNNAAEYFIPLSELNFR